MDDSVDLQLQLDQKRRAVDTDFFDMSLRELLRMVEARELIIAPAYQREFRWPEATQSALIESFLLGLPIPALVVAANTNATWEVVDGLQRLNTIIRFLGDDEVRSRNEGTRRALSLSGLETLTSFEGLTFDALPRTIQFILEKRFVRVQILNDQSDPEVRYELFKRLNAGAVALTPQEIRSCVYRGPFNDLVESLAQDSNFRSMLKLKRGDEHNGTVEEQVLKFFAYRDRSDSFDGRVTAFLSQYMKDRTENTGDLHGDEAAFQVACGQLAKMPGCLPFLRPGVGTTPLNQFEAALVATANLLSRGEQIKKPSAKWLEDKGFVDFATKGTNTRPQLLGRIKRAEQLLSGNA
jgi:hypothetical protein